MQIQIISSLLLSSLLLIGCSNTVHYPSPRGMLPIDPKSNKSRTLAFEAMDSLGNSIYSVGWTKDQQNTQDYGHPDSVAQMLKSKGYALVFRKPAQALSGPRESQLWVEIGAGAPKLYWLWLAQTPKGSLFAEASGTDAAIKMRLSAFEQAADSIKLP